MQIVHVVAVADNGVIGRDGGLPWHLSADLKHFKACTMGKPMIMGRKTYDSIGRPLPGRTSIVVTRDPDYTADGATVVQSVEEALAMGRTIAQTSGVAEVAIAGGAEIYRQTLPICDRIELTRIHLSPDGDAVYPELKDAEWRETGCDEAVSPDGIGYAFITLERI
ncbi:MAG: dihydrofolate reductase [Alphaproteobacteria bacterium]